MMETKAARGLFAALTAAATLLVGETARADDREMCATAADQAQQLRDDGKYRRAREQLLICARDACPAPIKRDCLDWLQQVENTAPTVVFGAKDGAKDISEVKVSVDGISVTERLDGKPVQMDLGKHTVKFEYQGQSKEEEIIIGAGQKNRTVTAAFGAPAAGAAGPGTTPPPGGETGEQTSGSLVPAFVVGGIGILAIGSFAIFGLSGKSDVDDLQACKPTCDQSRVDSARTKLVIADISLGVGIVAAAVTTYLVLTRPKIDATVKTGLAPAATPPPRSAWSTVRSTAGFDFGAVPGGGVGSLGARF